MGAEVHHAELGKFGMHERLDGALAACAVLLSQHTIIGDASLLVQPPASSTGPAFGGVYILQAVVNYTVAILVFCPSIHALLACIGPSLLAVGERAGAIDQSILVHAVVAPCIHPTEHSAESVLASLHNQHGVGQGDD